MLLLLIEQVALLLTAAALLGVPGAALVSLLRVRAALPDALAVPAGALLGALVACAATFAQLLLELQVAWPVAIHVALSLALAAAALAVRRRRRERGDEVVPVARGWDRWTTALALGGMAFAWLVRGTIRLDGLYHVALSRKLVELQHPNFDNVNRFVDGGPSPSYALPGWHALLGWTGWLTDIDPVLVWEILPVLVVGLGALAAAGLARVLLDTPRAQPLGALAWVLMRVLYARREVDGDAILFGAVPGQVVFELVLPVLFASIAVAMWTSDRRVLRIALATSFACIASVIVYHANYIPYVAIVGLGYAAWWAVSGPFGSGVGRRVLVVGGAVAGMCLACFAVVLPMLAGIDDFANPDETRIDYHLTETFGLTHIRGGHLYEMLGMPGLLAILVAPLVAWKWRSRELSVASGGLLALMTMCVVPPLFELMRGTGSLTVGLRINHVVGVLLGPMLVGALLLVADAVARREWTRRRLQLWSAVVVVLFIGAGMALGYEKFSPEWPGYLAWAAFVALFVARLAARVRRRARHASQPGETGLDQTATHGRTAAPGRLVLACALVVTIGLALPVGALSVRRAVVGMDAFTARTEQGDLQCLGGPVARALQQLPAGSTVLSDPVASFQAMALAPVYVVGDYKVWNATAQDEVAARLAKVNRFFDSSLDDDDRLAQLEEGDVDYLLFDVEDARWLDEDQTDATEGLERAWRGLDSFADFQAYDGGGVARLVGRHPERFERLALDPRARESALPPQTADLDAPCNSYGLWKVR